MADAYIFYNPLAGGGRILEDLDALQFVLDEDCVLCDMTKPETYGEALFAMQPEDYLVLCGGDGTLNRFVNLTGELDRPNEILYFPAGEHNDFAMDFGRRYGDNPFPVNGYIRDLPRVTVGNKSTAFLTGVSFCPQEGMPVSLRANADGTVLSFQNVRFAGVLLGKYAFGGMRPVPTHTRSQEDLTLLVIGNCSRLYARQVLHRLKKGKPLPKSRFIQCLCARELELQFDTQVQACADGEKLLLQNCRIGRGKEKT